MRAFSALLVVASAIAASFCKVRAECDVMGGLQFCAASEEELGMRRQDPPSTTYNFQTHLAVGASRLCVSFSFFPGQAIQVMIGGLGASSDVRLATVASGSILSGDDVGLCPSLNMSSAHAVLASSAMHAAAKNAANAATHITAAASAVVATAASRKGTPSVPQPPCWKSNATYMCAHVTPCLSFDSNSSYATRGFGYLGVWPNVAPETQLRLTVSLTDTMADAYCAYEWRVDPLAPAQACKKYASGRECRRNQTLGCHLAPWGFVQPEARCVAQLGPAPASSASCADGECGCDSVLCVNGGVCNPSSATCVCVLGYRGAHCEVGPEMPCAADGTSTREWMQVVGLFLMAAAISALAVATVCKQRQALRGGSAPHTRVASPLFAHGEHLYHSP